jgi:hypothetical protein
MIDIHRIPYEPTPGDIQAELSRLGITQVEAAELIRVNARTFRRYMQAPRSEGSTPMPFGSFALLRLAKRNNR